MPMIRIMWILAFIMPPVAVACAEEKVTEIRPPSVFATADGDIIELDLARGVRRGPGIFTGSLQDCSDHYQACFSDGRGFAFAYFRKCSRTEPDDYSRLRFQPKTVMVLHNDLWLVFDASPNFMFHYRFGDGIVGIYAGKTRNYDFRELLRKTKQGMDFSEGEYRLTKSGPDASCER